MKGIGAFFLVVGVLGLLADGFFELVKRGEVIQDPDDQSKERGKWEQRADEVAWEQARLWQKLRPLFIALLILGGVIYLAGWVFST